MAEKVAKVEGVKLKFPEIPFFNEVVISVEKDPASLNQELLSSGIIGGFPLGRWFEELDDCILLAVTERTTLDDIDYFCSELDVKLHSVEVGGDLR